MQVASSVAHSSSNETLPETFFGHVSKYYCSLCGGHVHSSQSCCSEATSFGMEATGFPWANLALFTCPLVLLNMLLSKPVIHTTLELSQARKQEADGVGCVHDAHP